MAFKVFTSGYVYKGADYSKVSSVTDKQDFRPDAEQVRALRVNPQGSGSTPVYDYPDGEVPKDDTITPLIIALRSGKLDKAEIAEVQQALIDAGAEASKNAEEKALSDAVKNVLGVGSESQKASE